MIDKVLRFVKGMLVVQACSNCLRILGLTDGGGIKFIDRVTDYIDREVCK